MLDLLPHISQWLADGKAVALATVVKVYGSAPRPLGAKMAVSSAGDMAGSVSGGCVESAVLQEALEVIADGQPRLIEYGIADELAQTVGLACGGTIEVFVERCGADFDPLRQAVAARRLVAQAIVLAGPDLGRRLLAWPDGRTAGDLGHAHLNQRVLARAADLLAEQRSERSQFTVAGQSSDVFIEVYGPPPRLLIVGAVHIAIPLVSFAKILGFHTTVIDARTAFATPERFAHADRLQVGWPDEALAGLNLDASCYVAVLSHDDKLDVPALQVALQSPTRYVGALGSRKTMAKRTARLRELGVTEQQLQRIHNPIGLDVGARWPEEIAVAIIAEIVAVRNGKRQM